MENNFWLYCHSLFTHKTFLRQYFLYVFVMILQGNEITRARFVSFKRDHWLPQRREVEIVGTRSLVTALALVAE